MPPRRLNMRQRRPFPLRARRSVLQPRPKPMPPRTNLCPQRRKRPPMRMPSRPRLPRRLGVVLGGTRRPDHLPPRRRRLSKRNLHPVLAPPRNRRRRHSILPHPPRPSNRRRRLKPRRLRLIGGKRIRRLRRSRDNFNESVAMVFTHRNPRRRATDGRRNPRNLLPLAHRRRRPRRTRQRSRNRPHPLARLLNNSWAESQSSTVTTTP